MRVLAFDPGFERLGIAMVERNPSTALSTSRQEELLYSDCIRTKATLPFAERLAILGKEVEQLIKKWEPDCTALENLYFENNAKTAMNVSAVRGMLLYISAKNGLMAYEYTPLQVKVATTGYGKSDKRAMALMVQKLVKITNKKMLDDELDAIAVGLTCLASVRN